MPLKTLLFSVLFSINGFALDDFSVVATDVPSSSVMSKLMELYPDAHTISARTGSLENGGGILTVLLSSRDGSFFEVLDLGSYKTLMSSPSKLTFSDWRKNLVLMSKINELCPLVFKVENSTLMNTNYDCSI